MRELLLRCRAALAGLTSGPVQILVELTRAPHELLQPLLPRLLAWAEHFRGRQPFMVVP